MTKLKPTALYNYRPDSDRCDELLTIYDVKTGEDILSLPFWSSDAAWAERTKARVKTLIANPELLKSLRGASEEEVIKVVKPLMAVQSTV